MNRLAPTIALAAASLLTIPAALAESIASSAASSASITASSASESFRSASNSSKSGNNTARAGDYRIETIAAAETAGKVLLTLQALQPTPDHSGFVLVLPQAALDAQGVVRGDTVSVRVRAYGFEFARADTKQAFFLVLADDWQRELDPRPVSAVPRTL
jgi:hypothetical protein